MKLVQGFAGGLITIPVRCDSLGLSLLKEDKVDSESHGRALSKKTYYISEFIHNFLIDLCISRT